MIWFVGLIAAGWVTSLVCFVICLGLPGRLAGVWLLFDLVGAS